MYLALTTSPDAIGARGRTQTVWSELNDENVLPKLRTKYAELEDLFSTAAKPEDDSKGDDGVGLALLTVPD